MLENGPNTVVSNDPLMDEHFAELGIAEEYVAADRQSGRRYLLLNGQLELLPTSPPSFFSSPVLSTAGKLRLLAEPFIPRAVTPDESIEMFFARRLGPEAAHNLVDPFVSGIYAGNPQELSMHTTFPTLWEAEQGHGSIVRGMIARSRSRKQQGPRKRSQMFNFRHGLQTWPQAIVQAIGPEHVRFNTRASALRSGDQGWYLTVTQNGTEEVLHSRRIVLAVPAYVAASLIAEMNPTAAQALRDIPYSPLAIVHLGYRRAEVQHPLDGFGMLCPSRENRGILGSLWPSTLFPERAPDEMVLTTSFVGGARSPDILQSDDEELIERVMHEQRAIIGATGEPVFARVMRWEQAISQYVAGHPARMEALVRLEAMLNGLYVLGNYRDGVSVEKCWHKGRDLGMHLPLPG
jgi:oxygen-dependent protoporphyrinogen oxidase